MNLIPLLNWSQREFSQLPWRKDRSLFKTLVSEIMLQQTTVGTVKNHFERFIAQFESLDSLASATEAELLIAWKGLGYYRRAKNLRKIAQSLVHDHKGKFPTDLETLTKIPGIGPYTANALIGIGMDKRAIAVDANLERVIARLFHIKMEKGLKLQKEIQVLFEKKQIFSQKVSFRKLNEALMDLGRTYCQARKVSCELCPLRNDCLSFSKGNPLLIPIQKKETNKKTIEHELKLIRIFVTKGNKILVYEKTKGEWLEGQFEVPTFILESTDSSIKQYPTTKTSFKGLFSFKTGITKYTIHNVVMELDEKTFKLQFPHFKGEWRSPTDQISNLSTATIKAFDLLSKKKNKN
jgi:A/G-specific adenine glycosylase